MRQHGLTTIAEILPAQVAALRKILNVIGNDISDNGIVSFKNLRTVHFMRWVIVPAATVHGTDIPPQLVLSTNFDGKLQPHLEELVREEHLGLQQIYAHCKDFPRSGKPDEIVAYLKDRSRKIAAFYVGTVGHTTRQIHQENELRNAIEDHLQTSNPAQQWAGQVADQIHQEIRDFVVGTGDAPFWEKKSRKTFLQVWGSGLLLGGLALIAGMMVISWNYAPVFSVIATGLVLGFFLLWFWRLRVAEKRDRADFVPLANVPKQIEELNQREDFKVQNQITHLVNVKPGWERQFALRFVLWAINLLARMLYNKGNLAGIPSIHFARWTIIDGGKRLLFFSNFDGSWESYLGEFIDRAAVGLTGVWSNTEGFPPTKDLIKEGARHSVEFKAWVRAHQLETQVWYSAYKTISVSNISNNTTIRNGMRRKMKGKKAQTWLQKL